MKGKKEMLDSEAETGDDADEEDEDEVAWREERKQWNTPSYRNAMYEGNPDSLIRAIEGYEAAATSSVRHYPPHQFPFLYEHDSAGSDPEPAWEPWQLYLRDHPDIAAKVLQGHPVAAASLLRS